MSAAAADPWNIPESMTASGTMLTERQRQDQFRGKGVTLKINISFLNSLFRFVGMRRRGLQAVWSWLVAGCLSRQCRWRFGSREAFVSILGFVGLGGLIMLPALWW